MSGLLDEQLTLLKDILSRERKRARTGGPGSEGNPEKESVTGRRMPGTSSRDTRSRVIPAPELARQPRRDNPSANERSEASAQREARLFEKKISTAIESLETRRMELSSLGALSGAHPVFPGPSLTSTGCPSRCPHELAAHALKAALDAERSARAKLLEDSALKSKAEAEESELRQSRVLDRIRELEDALASSSERARLEARAEAEESFRGLRLCLEERIAALQNENAQLLLERQQLRDARASLLGQLAASQAGRAQVCGYAHDVRPSSSVRADMDDLIADIGRLQRSLVSPPDLEGSPSTELPASPPPPTVVGASPTVLEAEPQTDAPLTPQVSEEQERKFCGHATQEEPSSTGSGRQSAVHFSGPDDLPHKSDTIPGKPAATKFGDVVIDYNDLAGGPPRNSRGGRPSKSAKPARPSAVAEQENPPRPASARHARAAKQQDPSIQRRKKARTKTGPLKGRRPDS